MTDRQDPLEQLLDVFVYAPLGMAMEARDLLPKLADKGRRQLGGKVTVARMVGELAVRQGRKKAEKVIEGLRQQQASGHPGSGAAGSPAGGRSPSPRIGLVPEPADRPPARTASASELAIPGYDTLSASQVLPRLVGLSPEELEAVRSYEEATRARKTVLTRIEQLGNPG